jgi:hypothetical protein
MIGQEGIVWAMADSLNLEDLRRIVGDRLTSQEAEALATWYANLARSVAAFPTADLKDVEPPLRSIAGPKAP